ncbi:MAG: hypothetical protein JXB17_01520, partial [Bacteroidales bacterium]|nr:hypothetical protein [Bacteroidales bacterium]
MKNKIYYIGLIACVSIITGCIFKIMHWPGAGIILTISILLLSLIFLPIAFISSYKNSGKKRKWLFIAAFLTLFVDFTGALFKIMHWPGAGIFLTVGMLLPVILFLPVYLYHHYREKEESLKNFMYIIFFLVYYSVMSALLALNVSKSVLDNAVVVGEIIDISDYYTYKNEIEKKTTENNQAIDIMNRTNKLLDIIDDIKIEIILNITENNNMAIDENKKIILGKIIGKDNKDAVLNILLREGKASLIKKEIENYKTYILSIIGNSNAELVLFCNQVLNTQPKIIQEKQIPWEIFNFENLHLIFAINKLTEIENNIKLAEL